MASSSVLLLLILLGLAAEVFGLRTCYYPDGTTISPYKSCGNEADEEYACCNTPQDVCLQNGLCLWPQYGLFFLNGCTDPTWQSYACGIRGLSLPSSCLTATANQTNQQIFYCSDQQVCCGPVGDNSCCGNSSSHFDFDNGFVASQSTPAPSTGGTTSSSSSATASSTTPSISVITSFSSPSACPTSETTSSKCTNKIGEGVGIGIGAVGGLALLLLTAWFFTKRHYTAPRRKSTLAPPETPRYQDHSGKGRYAEVSAAVPPNELGIREDSYVQELPEVR